MRFLSLYTAFSLAFAPLTAISAEARKSAPLSYQLAKALQIYASVETVNQAFAYMKVGAKESDTKFLDEMTRRLNGQRLPAATLKGQLIYFQGLAKPLAVVDAGRGVFSYGGRKVSLVIGEAGIEGKMKELEGIFAEESAGWFGWLLPKAHALDRNGLLGIVSGAMLGGGLAMTVTGLFSGGEGVGMGVGLAALGAIGLFTANDRAMKKKRKLTCKVDGGLAKLTSTNGYGEDEQLLAVNPPPYPHQPPGVIPPPTGTYPPPATAISPIVSICKYPAEQAKLNLAMSTPTTLPGYYPVSPGVPVTGQPASMQPGSLQGVPADSEKNQD